MDEERRERAGGDGTEVMGAAIASGRDRVGWSTVLNGLRCPAGHDEDKHIISKE